jgi:hypothetical protein
MQALWKLVLLVEFSYNNHYQASTKLSPFEILYGRKCNTPVSWSNHVNRLMIGPYMLKYMELTVKQVQQNLKVAEYRKKVMLMQKGLQESSMLV